MKVQSKMILSVGSAAVITALLVFFLFYFKTSSFLKENAKRTVGLLEESAREQVHSDSVINALNVETLFRSMFLHLEMLNMVVADTCNKSPGKEVFPLAEALEMIYREKGGSEVRYFPPEVESVLVVADGYGKNEWRESCSETNNYTSEVEVPPELQNFRRNFTQNTAMIVVPPDNKGYIWAAASKVSGGKYNLAAYKISTKRLLENFVSPEMQAQLFLMHGRNIIGFYKQGSQAFPDATHLKTRMKMLASRLVSIMGKRHFEMETLVCGKDGQKWDLAAVTLQTVSTPARELRLVQASPSDAVPASFLKMEPGRILFLGLFILLGLLLFFIALLLNARDFSNSIKRILDFSTRLSRGEELPENLRAGTTEEIQEISSTLNHLRDKFASLTVRLKKSHEREMLAKSDAESSNRMKSALLNDMITELQDPVSLMISFSGLLLHKLKNQEEYLVPLRKIHEEALAANRLLIALGNLSDLDLSDRDPSYSEFDISEVMREVSDACVPLSSERHVAFETCCAEMPEKIISDHAIMVRLLKLAAATLLSVAPPKTRVRWTCSDREQEICFRFYDTRVSDVLSLADLFNERIQFSASRRSIPGFAAPILNLTIIKLQAALLGARFLVRRTDESNTEIELAFPKQDVMDIVLSGDAEEKENTRHSRTSTSIPVDRNRKVYVREGQRYEMLVADKSSSGFAMFSMMLENEPCVLTHAETPEECIRMLKEKHFDFLLLDLNFQRAFCTPLLAAIRTGNNKGLVILALSPGLTEAELAAIMESGVDRCLRKPVSVESLVAAVHDYIGG